MGASWVPLGCLLGVSWVLLGAPGCSWLLLAAVGFPGPLPRMPSPPSPPPIRSNPSSIHASGHQARGGARAWLPLPPSGFSELLADVFVARAFCFCWLKLAVMAQTTLLSVCNHDNLFLLLADFLVEADPPDGELLALYYNRLRWFDESSWICKGWLEAWKQVVGPPSSRVLQRQNSFSTCPHGFSIDSSQSC